MIEREPIITGKPSPFLMSDIAAKHSVSPSRSIMVGDRLDTDIAWGINTGMATLLVLTGKGLSNRGKLRAVQRVVVSTILMTNHHQYSRVW